MERNHGKGGQICHFLKMSLCRRGRGLAGKVSVEGGHIVISILRAVSHWYWMAEVEPVEADGRLTI